MPKKMDRSGLEPETLAFVVWSSEYFFVSTWGNRGLIASHPLALRVTRLTSPLARRRTNVLLLQQRPCVC